MRNVFMMIPIAAVIAAFNPAFATQLIPGGVEYSNDKIEQGGRVQACIITVAIISPPSPEIVNLQFLIFPANSVAAFKVTAGDMNWNNKLAVARRISTALFSTGKFNHPAAFKKTVTDEGQLLAILTDASLNDDFFFAFIGGRYSITFRRTDLQEERTYSIEKGPERAIMQSFADCLRSATN